ncbi:hypothetical protein STEG23_015011 [Scotinomys teguina]
MLWLEPSLWVLKSVVDSAEVNRADEYSDVVACVRQMLCASRGSQAEEDSYRDLDLTLTLLYLQGSNPDSDPADVVSCSGCV